MSPRLRLEHITKAYPGIVANNDISLDVAPGEVLAILGENGAGKSTLMKIIFGSVKPDRGTIEFDGRAVQVTSPSVARELGIAMVHQHFALFETLTVAQNVILGLSGSMPLEAASRRIAELGERYGIPVDPEAYVADLAMGERQRVEIIRALADRCTVLRAGTVVDTVVPSEKTEEELARLMIGAEPPKLEQRAGNPGEPALELLGVGLSGGHHVTGLSNIRLSVRAGEIVGIAGISGNGQSRLLGVCMGELPVEQGTVKIFGEVVNDLDPAERRARGLRYVPEQRLGHGSVPEFSLLNNTLLTGDHLHSRGFINHEAARRFTEEVIADFDVKTSSVNKAAQALSGGNLQKFIVGREILQKPRILIVDQPTWGVDVGAATVIRNALLKLRGEGAAIVVVSEEIDELFEISDRIAVMYRGTMSPAVPVQSLTMEELGRWMAGLWTGSPFKHQAREAD